MKTKADRFVAAILLLCLLAFFVPSSVSHEPPTLRLYSLGIPYAETEARNPWDMIAYEGYLYLGAGDYDKNVSPGTVMRLSLDSLTWETLLGYDDEQAERFLLVNGKLLIPGIDAKEGWEYGNYYTVEENTLVKHRVLTGGVHVWDMAFFDGKTFAALGTAEGDSPLLVSEDGEQFSPLAFVEEDGKETLLSTPHYTLRIYDLFTVDEVLYAIVTRYETANSSAERLVYCYAGDGAMHRVGPLSDEIAFVRLRYFPIIAKATVGDSLFFTTGKLYETKDMQTFVDITPKDSLYIADMIEAEGALYALGFTMKEDGETLLNTLYRYENGTFLPIARFDSAVVPLSFTVVGNRFFVAFGKMNGILDYQGEVYYAFLQ